MSRDNDWVRKEPPSGDAAQAALQGVPVAYGPGLVALRARNDERSEMAKQSCRPDQNLSLLS